MYNHSIMWAWASDGSPRIEVGRSFELVIQVVRVLFVVVLALCGVSVAYVLYIFTHHRITAIRSTLRNLPGPENMHWFKGNFVDVAEPASARLQEEWVRTYGHVLKYYAVFATPKLLAVDPVAVSYILQNSDIFQKSELIRFSLRRVTGSGLLSVEGPQHRKQRKVMNPAFGPVQVREFTSVFFEKSLELREIWADLLAKSPRKDGKLNLDALNWLNKVTLDIIGLAGFGYTFDLLHSPDEEQNDLYRALHTILKVAPGNVFFALQLFFPIFRRIPTRSSRALDHAFETVMRIGSELIQNKKNAILAESNANGSGAVEKHNVRGHDLLSLLIKSNIASDTPESMRMSDSEVLSQMPTFLLAGNETTSTAVSWTLFALCCRPAVQTKLRAELRTCATDSPTMEQLNTLPYLEAVVREVLRLYAPVSSTQRIAVHDVEIPLQKPFTDKRGVSQSTIRVSKGDLVTIPIRLLNRSTEIWGENANEFRPERWEDLPEAVNALPSVYGHLLTFIAGTHACIGYRFSVVEMKALLFTLLRAFEFELALPAEDIVRTSTVVGRPGIASNPAAGAQLPLLIRLADTD